MYRNNLSQISRFVPQARARPFTFRRANGKMTKKARTRCFGGIKLIPCLVCARWSRAARTPYIANDLFRKWSYGPHQTAARCVHPSSKWSLHFCRNLSSGFCFCAVFSAPRGVWCVVLICSVVRSVLSVLHRIVYFVKESFFCCCFGIWANSSWPIVPFRWLLFCFASFFSFLLEQFRHACVSTSARCHIVVAYNKRSVKTGCVRSAAAKWRIGEEQREMWCRRGRRSRRCPPLCIVPICANVAGWYYFISRFAHTRRHTHQTVDAVWMLLCGLNCGVRFGVWAVVCAKNVGILTRCLFYFEQ